MLKDFGLEWKEAARVLKDENTVLVGWASASPWGGGRAGRMLEEL